MQFLTDLRALLAYHGFRQLFAVRLASQFTDGMFQVALASYLLFSPERAPNAGAIAAGFAVLLLPFSVLGPFCGVLLDRWSRRQVLVWSNLARSGLLACIVVAVAFDRIGAPFFVLVLAALSVNRFFLAALSAALPHVVPARDLVMANAVSPTCGTLSYMVGLGLGSVVSFVAGAGGLDEVPVLILAGMGYVGAAAVAARIPRTRLGPEQRIERSAVREAVGNVVRGLVAGGRHVLSRRGAAYGLGAIGVHRFFYGTSTVMIILLYRNYFSPHDVEAGMAGMASAVIISGAGFGAAALLTPVVVRRIGTRRWIVLLFSVAAVIEIVPAALYTPWAVLVAAFVLGITAQGIKICVDTLVQRNIDDAYRGRVFSFYDVLFNVVFVASAAFAAAVLPVTGKSYAILGLSAACYAATAIAYARLTARPPVAGTSEDSPPLTAYEAGQPVGLGPSPET